MAQEGIEHVYRVAAWWTSGKTGIAKSDSAPNAIHFTVPAKFGGLEGRWTPEELLLAAVASCFTTTVRSLANNTQYDFSDLEVEALARIRKVDTGYAFDEVIVRPTLRISDRAEREYALNLLKRAHQRCLVSRALDVPLRLEPQLEVVEPVEVV
jgi:organic hydroperoxide reductase OsmC/OhrA